MKMRRWLCIYEMRSDKHVQHLFFYYASVNNFLFRWYTIKRNVRDASWLREGYVWRDRNMNSFLRSKSLILNTPNYDTNIVLCGGTIFKTYIERIERDWIVNEHLWRNQIYLLSFKLERTTTTLVYYISQHILFDLQERIKTSRPFPRTLKYI